MRILKIANNIINRLLSIKLNKFINRQKNRLSIIPPRLCTLVNSFKSSPRDYNILFIIFQELILIKKGKTKISMVLPFSENFNVFIPKVQQVFLQLPRYPLRFRKSKNGNNLRRNCQNLRRVYQLSAHFREGSRKIPSWTFLWDT